MCRHKNFEFVKLHNRTDSSWESQISCGSLAILSAASYTVQGLCTCDIAFSKFEGVFEGDCEGIARQLQR